MEETLIERIGEAYLNPTFVDGQVLLHTTMNEIVSITKMGINENYKDIQRIINGALVPDNSTKLNGATLAKAIDGQLQSNDNTVPTSQQVKQYIDTAVQSLDQRIAALEA
jgi:hypothetical protein